MPTSLSALLEARRRTLQIIHGTFLAALGAYLAVAWVVVRERGGSAGPPVFLVVILGLAALGTVGVSLVLPRVLLDEERVKAVLDRQDSPVGVRADDPAAQRALALAGLYQHARIVGWAAAESASIFGLILVLLGGPLWYYPVFAGLSLVLLLLAPPRLDDFLRHRGAPTGEG